MKYYIIIIYSYYYLFFIYFLSHDDDFISYLSSCVCCLIDLGKRKGRWGTDKILRYYYFATPTINKKLTLYY